MSRITIIVGGFMDSVLKTLLRDLHPDALDVSLLPPGAPAYRAEQLVGWVYRKNAFAWNDMSNIPKAMRDALTETYDLSGLELQERQVSKDGTRKYLFSLRDGQTIESVLIPMEQHATFCLSSQVGCAMACRFCATARGGLVRNLSRGEIVEQVQRLAADVAADPVPELGDRGFNVVFMGMGEPLDNLPEVAGAINTMTDERGLGLSPRRITVSTSGHREGLQAFLDSGLKVGLTLSVNATEAQQRRSLMPVPGRTPLAESIELTARHARAMHRPMTIAYVLIEDVNDRLEDADRLAALLTADRFKINLIPMNRIDERFGPPPAERMLAFQERLKNRGWRATIRVSGGDDIDAACGQLRRRRGA